MSPEQGTSAVYTMPSDTASPGFHNPDTLDWSSRLAQVKNRLIVVQDAAAHLPTDAPTVEDGTDDSNRERPMGSSMMSPQPGPSPLTRANCA